jgi:hypothetical protein
VPPTCRVQRRFRGGTLGRRAFATGIGSSALLAALPAGAKPLAPIPTLPLSIAVAVEGGRAVREEPWIQAQLAEVARLFGPFGVRFTRTEARVLPERLGHLETRKDRDALDAERVAGVVNAFVVASMRDVDDTRMYRMGVHWRNTVRLAHRYVIVTGDALASTLAHELGHYLGLPHATALNNLMSYARSGEGVFLTRGQGMTLRTYARMALASGEVGPRENVADPPSAEAPVP